MNCTGSLLLLCHIEPNEMLAPACDFSLFREQRRGQDPAPLFSVTEYFAQFKLRVDKPLAPTQKPFSARLASAANFVSRDGLRQQFWI